MDNGTAMLSKVGMFFQEHPEHKDILKPFTHGFRINHVSEQSSANTVLFIYLLEALDHIKEQFGIDKEILLAYAPYQKMEPRSLQALHNVLKKYPFNTRIDSLSCFFISDDADIKEWMQSASMDNDITQIVITFTSSELKESKNDPWFIRNKLIKDCYIADLFEYSLPLREDSFFFGRQQDISRAIDSIRRCENRGVFGLRKTGKTSLLFKIERIINEQKMGVVIYIDCKSPSWRMKQWHEFLAEICKEIALILKLERFSYSNTKSGILGALKNVMKEAQDRNQRVVLLFDEIEYISFISPLDQHWRRDFIDFWQTMWSVQSQHRNLVFVVCGVNASAVERDMIDSIQNPLFGIVQSSYLKGFSLEETKIMIRVIGKRMGLRFEHDAIDEIYKQYGGHPMLTRRACSTINRLLFDESRPISISLKKAVALQEDVNIELLYYFQHVVSEIKQFYPDEYELFEMLASGQIGDFMELSQVSEYSRHLYDYGLVVKNNNIPTINMPVAGRYAALELAKREQRRELFKIVTVNKRNDWIRQRVKSIISDLRQLEMIIKSLGKHSLFGANSFPEAEKFAMISTVSSESSFIDFINVCNRCFVESIENYGVSIGKRKYFWNEIKTEYPAIFPILHRIKVYRHWSDHSQLKPEVAKNLQTFLSEDTDGVNQSNKFFVIQQKLLDGFFTNIQAEMINLE